MTTTRRDFLKTTLGASALVSLSPFAPSLLCRTARAADLQGAGSDNTALIVIQLSGGNDGLNCIVPYANDVYARLRTTLRLTAQDVHRVDDTWGFHPAMTECRRLFDEGLFAVVQGVGYPESKREHPDAERDWHTARPEDTHCETGWIGRYADHFCESHPGSAPASMISTISKPLGLTAERAIVPTLRSPKEAAITADLHRAEHAAAAGIIGGARDQGANPLLAVVRESTATAHAASHRIAKASNPNVEYPDTKLSAHLKDIATLIRAEAGFRVFYTNLGGDGFGGFDNHAFQKDHHASLLRELSGAIGAFIDDLRADGLCDRVAVMTISEFGRTVTENGRHGTNHGAAAPLFLAGGALTGGVIGAHPDLADLDKDAPRHHTDFRQVYATMLTKWLGCDPVPILGGDFKPLDLFKGRPENTA